MILCKESNKSIVKANNVKTAQVNSKNIYQMLQHKSEVLYKDSLLII